MKIAISIADNLSSEADRVAEELGVSRSGLYARAISELLKRHRDHIITEKLDEIYAAEGSSMDPVFREMQRRVFETDPYVLEEPAPETPADRSKGRKRN